jgi:hypothetical protein
MVWIGIAFPCQVDDALRDNLPGDAWCPASLSERHALSKAVTMA